MKAPMKTLCLSLLIVAAMGLGTDSRAEDYTAQKPAAQAEPTLPAGMKMIPEDLTADLNLSIYSQYIWRGYALSRDSLVFFPSLTVGYKGFAVNVWTDLDTNYYAHTVGDKKRFKLPETDVTVTYSNAFTPLKLNYTLGWIYYDTKGSDGNSPYKNQEVFLTLGLDTLLKPTFSVYQEIEKGHAWYFQLGVSHSFAVYKDCTLDLAASISYMNNKSFNNFSDLHDGNVSAGFKIPFNKYLSVKPTVQYSFPLSSAAARDIRNGSFGRGDNFVYGGLIFDLAI